ncbi:MAG: 2'-5' RNA ligase family protein [Candidatus Bathyarchaeota archaeon]|nr:2'-5' RNA ligase family protein [Candidatus Bathyarchaeota archaeon]
MRLDHKSQSKEYDSIWENRYQSPIIMESWTDNDWAKGRTEYLVFLVKINDQSIKTQVTATHEKLAEYRCIDTFPLDYLHLTVKETGLCLTDEKTSDDEITRDELDQLVEEAGEIIKQYEPFEVSLERLNNFKAVVCVEGHDGGVIRDINKNLREKLGLKSLFHDPNFLPHMSITQYKSTEDYQELIQYLEKARDTKIGTVSVDRVMLVIAHLPSEGMHPWIEIVEEFPLKH